MRMERLSFIIGILGIALTLIAFDPDHFAKAKIFLYDAGVGLILLCIAMFVWPSIIAWRRSIIAGKAPINLGLFYQVVLGMGLPDSNEGYSAFVQALLHMVSNGELVLLGRRNGEELEAVPPSHFKDHGLASIPRIGTGQRIFVTVKGSDYRALLDNEGSYDRLHLPKDALGSIPILLEYTKQLLLDPVTEKASIKQDK